MRQPENSRTPCLHAEEDTDARKERKVRNEKKGKEGMKRKERKKWPSLLYFKRNTENYRQ